MAELLRSLQCGAELSVGMVQYSSMLPFCACGRLNADFDIAITKDVAHIDISNLDDWSRATFIPVPVRLHEFYYG